MLSSVLASSYWDHSRGANPVGYGLVQAGFFLSADRGSFKMLVAKEVTAGFAFRIFEGRTIARGVGDRFSMAGDPAREQWNLR